MKSTKATSSLPEQSLYPTSGAYVGFDLYMLRADVLSTIKVKLKLTLTNRAMVRDEERYPDPEEFRPERFLNEDGSVKRDERILAYGFGRR